MRSWIPGGDLGTWATLRAMRQLVRAAISERLTLETAQAIVATCPPRDLSCEAMTLRAWLADHYRFVRDPAQQETLRTPQLQLEQLARDGVVSGDCDDAAVLGAALAAAIGFRPYAMVTAFRKPGAAFRHVFTVLPLDPSGTQWVDLDVTRSPTAPRIPISRSLGWRL